MPLIEQLRAFAHRGRAFSPTNDIHTTTFHGNDCIICKRSAHCSYFFASLSISILHVSPSCPFLGRRSFARMPAVHTYSALSTPTTQPS
jgi:hypothetical protein